MPEPIDNYEQVSVYHLEPERRESLLTEHNECTFAWTTRDGWPVSVIMSYLWRDGRFWLTAGAHRHRVSAVRRDPRVCVTVSSICLLYTSPSPRDGLLSRMPSSA